MFHLEFINYHNPVVNFTDVVKFSIGYNTAILEKDNVKLLVNFQLNSLSYKLFVNDTIIVNQGNSVQYYDKNNQQYEEAGKNNLLISTKNISDISDISDILLPLDTTELQWKVIHQSCYILLGNI